MWKVLEDLNVNSSPFGDMLVRGDRMSEKFQVQYWGDFPDYPFRSPAILSINEANLKIESFDEVSEHKNWSFKIPLEKIKKLGFVRSEQATAWRLYWMGPLLTHFFPKKTYFIRITYEDELGLMEDLMLTTLQPDPKDSIKISIIEHIRSQIKAHMEIKF